MKITQIRNATIIVEFDKICLLNDSILADKGALPVLKFLDGKRGEKSDSRVARNH